MLICGDSLKWLDQHDGYRTIFADPPDNINLKYANYTDNLVPEWYISWLQSLLYRMIQKSTVSWLSFNHIWMPWVLSEGQDLCEEFNKEWKLIIWRYTFGQYRTKDFGNGFRPILRITDKGWRPDTSRIRVESARQKLGDKRAADGGRVPDDVWNFEGVEGRLSVDNNTIWDFPRVVGNATERRTWHPTQHPEALLERIVLCSGGPVLDMFGGTGTTLRVCRRLGIDCDIVEVDPYYALHIEAENKENVQWHTKESSYEKQ